MQTFLNHENINMEESHVFLIIASCRKYQRVVTYNRTNRVFGQIREKSDLGLSRINLPSVGQFGKPRSLFSRIDLKPG